MAVLSTVLNVSSVAQVLISTATTWADIRDATISDPTPVVVFNDSAVRVWIGSTALTKATGFPLLSSAYLNLSLLKTDTIFVVSSAGTTATVRVFSGRQ